MDFQTVGKIVVRSGDLISHKFEFDVCTSATSFDGTLPYGTLISSCAVTAYDEDDNDVTSELISADICGTTTIDIQFKYPTSGNGRYKIKFVLTLSNSEKKVLWFTRVYAESV